MQSKDITVIATKAASYEELQLGNNIFVWQCKLPHTLPLPTPLIPLTLSSNGCKRRRFTPTTVVPHCLTSCLGTVCDLRNMCACFPSIRKLVTYARRAVWLREQYRMWSQSHPPCYTKLMRDKTRASKSYTGIQTGNEVTCSPGPLAQSLTETDPTVWLKVALCKASNWAGTFQFCYPMTNTFIFVERICYGWLSV